MKRVELLAPAGNFTALKGAINAGADAVYLGGDKYGARAYADNFSKEEICEGIHLAHVFGKKIYLTVNTLVKEKELDELYSFLLPYYESGLDGVIVQDLGALRYTRKHFPGMELHASTQMTLTGSYGTDFLKEEGISRIVPARELSLEEMKEIKHSTGVEIEAFIHGAMCYCYSGQCLFSSILGGRSGNRGRCAQPCRLPYSIGNGKEQYPLSMRDMCTIQLLPQLIEAGIDSFKIEGRMKKPAYAAGVTSIYRKYIDLYYENKDAYHVEASDMKMLNSLYIRSEVGDGYYQRHNGKDMITLDSPAYSETSEELLRSIELKYMEHNPARSAKAEIILTAGEPAICKLESGEAKIFCKGDIVQTALKQPLSQEKIIQQIKKCGNSLIDIQSVEVHTEGQVFMPVGALNELRRNAIHMLERELIRKNGLLYEEREAQPVISEAAPEKNVAINQMCSLKMHVSVRTLEQLTAALHSNAERIYIDYGLLRAAENLRKAVEEHHKGNKQVRLYVATPYIVRKKDIKILEEIKNALTSNLFEGVLIRNLESYGYFAKELDKEKIILDVGMYLWNRESVAFWEHKATEFYLPVECNAAENRELLEACHETEMEYSILAYGRLPMMITANCLKKTSGICRKEAGVTMLKDRYGKLFPVLNDCLCCYNIVYNSVPLSLHKQLLERKSRYSCYRLDFTVEDEKETEKVLLYFQKILKIYEEPPYQEYTTGHYKRGVE